MSNGGGGGGGNRFQCQYCTFSAASHAKLQSHMAIHYNLKPFMCPVCKRRANFKWDIQKHMRKIHGDYTSEVVCLSESEARESISSYIESMPSSTTAAAAAFNSATGSPAKFPLQVSNANNNNNNNNSNSNSGYGKFANSLSQSLPNNNSNGGSGLKEKRFRCSLCTRVNSRWQYDVKKHIRYLYLF